MFINIKEYKTNPKNQEYASNKVLLYSQQILVLENVLDNDS